MPTVVKVLGGYLEVDIGGTGGQPPGIWGGGNEGFPTHPIAPGGPPPGIWPSPGHPSHPIAPGGRPPFPSQGPGFPTHPIAPGGPPPGIWGGGNMPYPDQGLPGQGGTPHPEHPIPPTIWIGPILPPGAEEPDPEEIEWHSAWSAETGWVTVGIPTGEVPTPSEGEQQPPPPKK
jgi:hypothetical protein